MNIASNTGERTMKLAYIAGPYRAKTTGKIFQNIRHASNIALNWWNKGYAVICPHKNTAFFDGLADDNIWLRGDLEMIKRMDPTKGDTVVMLTGWAESKGAIAEHNLAVDLGLTIAYEPVNNNKEDLNGTIL